METYITYLKKNKKVNPKIYDLSSIEKKCDKLPVNMWRDSSGNLISIKSMPNKHLQNTIYMIQRSIEYLWINDLYERFMSESLTLDDLKTQLQYTSIGIINNWTIDKISEDMLRTIASLLQESFIRRLPLTKIVDSK